METDRKPCPYCGEQILKSAVKCPACREFLRGGPGLSPDEYDRISLQLERLLASAKESPNTSGQPGKFRIRTPVLVLLSGLAWSALAMANKDWLPFAILVAIILSIWALAALIRDLITPSPRGRTKAPQAAKCFFRSIRYGHWKKAYACVAPFGKEENAAPTPSFAELGVEPGEYDFTSCSGFRKYWKSFTRSSGVRARLIRGMNYTWDRLSPDVVRLRVRIRVETYNQLILLTLLAGLLVAVIVYLVVRKEHAAEFDVLLVRHRSQWWVFTGQAGTAFERAYRPAQEPGARSEPVA